MKDEALLAALGSRIEALGQRPARPVTAKDLETAERKLGFALPPTLKLVLSRVGNGGFGPGYGLMGLSGGATDDQGETLETWYLSNRELAPKDEDGPTWPEALVPLCTWGGGAYSCVDATRNDEPVIRFHPGRVHSRPAPRSREDMAPEVDSHKAQLVELARRELAEGSDLSNEIAAVQRRVKALLSMTAAPISIRDGLEAEGFTLREWLAAWAKGDEVMTRGLGKRTRTAPRGRGDRSRA